MLRFLIPLCCVLFFFTASAFSDQENTGLGDIDLDFTIEDVEKKPYTISAEIEVTEILRFLDSDALLFKQKYLDQKKEDTFWQTDIDFGLEGKYEWEFVSVYSRINILTYHNEDDGWESERKAEEAYISYQPSASLAVDAGKKVHKWGKGYAFSPAAFFSRPKDIDDPDATLEGYYSLSVDYIKSSIGVIDTVAVTPVLMPVTRDINHELGGEDELIFGGKLYLFTFDTDIDLMFMASDNLNDRIGVDFSKNISPSFEIHGEAALIKDHLQYIIDESGSTSEQKDTVASFLLGLRYLTKTETTYILEYYHNGQGYTEQEFKNYFQYIENAYEQYLNTSSISGISKSRQYAGFYNKQAAMRDYIYLKISQKDPFDILYLTPSLTMIYNVNDNSGLVTPGAAYSPVDNLDLDLKAGFLWGKRQTEYNEKINAAKIEFSITYYF